MSLHDCVRTARLALVLACLLASVTAHAHKPSDSYLTLRIEGSEIVGQWDIALRDLDLALGLDTDQDGAITWGEVRKRHADIAAYALTRVQLLADGANCPSIAGEHLVDRHSDGAYAVLRFTTHCQWSPATLELRYRLLFDLDPQHRGLLQLQRGAQVTSAIFAANTPSQRFELADADRLHQFLAYVRHGVWHIWHGFDHILFLLSLLFPAVLMRSATGWRPAEQPRAAALDVLKVVTAFTLAHSVTLS